MLVNGVRLLDERGEQEQLFGSLMGNCVVMIDENIEIAQYSGTQITDALDSLTGFSYDPNEDLLTVTDAEAHTTTYMYDNMDRMQARTDAPNRHTSYQHDTAGRRTALTYLDKGQHQYA